MGKCMTNMAMMGMADIMRMEGVAIMVEVDDDNVVDIMRTHIMKRRRRRIRHNVEMEEIEEEGDNRSKRREDITRDEMDKYRRRRRMGKRVKQREKRPKFGLRKVLRIRRRKRKLKKCQNQRLKSIQRRRVYMLEKLLSQIKSILCKLCKETLSIQLLSSLFQNM